MIFCSADASPVWRGSVHFSMDHEAVRPHGESLYLCLKFPIRTYSVSLRNRPMVVKNRTSREQSEGKTPGEITEKGSQAVPMRQDGAEPELKAIIILIDHLSPEDRDAVYRMPHLAVDLGGDLLQHIIHLHDENVKLQKLALIDDLTGLYNSRYFLIQLEAERARTRRTGFPFCLLMIDLDNFKLLNDGFGHLEGNRFLREVGRVLREQMRPTDIVCRYGGDEFTVIMPATRLFDSFRIAERLNTAIRRLSKPEGLLITGSIGIVEYSAESPWELDELIRLADAAMYNAKDSGKNKVSLYGGVENASAWSGEVRSDEKEALFGGASATTL